jgi:hypothetical protein
MARGMVEVPIEPISLYIDLETGQKADLEVVARAALSFAAAIRETAQIFDPSMTVRVELVSGTDGSLSINSRIRSIRPGDLITRKRLISVAITAILWFTHETGRWTFDEVLHFVFGTQYAAHLSKEETDEIAARVAEALERRTAQGHVAQVYRELETDSAVRGIGATENSGARPDRIVPRSEFAERAGSVTAVTEESEIIRQTRRTPRRVTVIRPVLESGRGAWQFSGVEGRFFAPVRDLRFLDDLLTGRIVVPMRSGIEMDIDLDTTEEKQDGAWVVQSRVVVAVRRVYPTPVQGSLPLAPPRPDHDESEDSSDDDER